MLEGISYGEKKYVLIERQRQRGTEAEKWRIGIPGNKAVTFKRVAFKIL